MALFLWVESTVYSLQYTVYTIYISPCTVLWVPEVNNDLVYCIFGLVQGLSLCGWTLYRIYNYTSVISPCTVLRIPEVNNDLVYCIMYIFGLGVQWLWLCGWTLYRIYISPCTLTGCTVLWIPEVNNDLA